MCKVVGWIAAREDLPVPKDNDPTLRCTLVSWQEVYELARRLASTIRDSGFEPDLVVAIGRGGWVPARVLCDFLGVMDLTSVKVEHYRGTHKAALARIRYPLCAGVSGRRVLIVDDVSDTGDTFQVAVEHVRGLGRPAQLRTAVIHHKVVARFVPDYYAQAMHEWRWIVYPWAVIEDVSELARQIRPVPGSLGELAERLREAHDIRVPAETLRDVARPLDLRR